LAEANLNAQHDVSYALSRLGHFELVRPVLLANYQYMLAHHVLSEAVYALLLLVGCAICTGDLSEAADWLQEAENSFAIAGVPTQRKAGVYSAKANLALYAGRLDEAEAIVNEMCDRYRIVQTPRFGAIALSLKVLIKTSRGDAAAVAALAPELHRAYERAGHLGGQDHLVEALWSAAHCAGHPADASKLLIEYLCSRRRELTPPEAPLRSATATDSAWDLYSSVSPRSS
jgi:ATP/maltotriose-dependent transcriptional regulator MalT